MLLRVLVRGELTNEQYVARAFDLGAHDYLLKSASAAELMHAVKIVAAGQPFSVFSHWDGIAAPALYWQVPLATWLGPRWG